MQLIFNNIIIKNFLSIEKETFDYSKYSGINLICGVNADLPDVKNGAGKSTLFYALIYVLFGKLINDLPNEKIPNRYISPKEKTEIILELIADGVKYKIIRGLTGVKNKSTFLNVYKFNSETNEYDEANNITKSSISETQKYIERYIIKCNIKIFLRSILLTSDNAYNFFKLEKKEKNEFIEHLFDLKIFGTMFELLHKEVLKMDKELFGYISEAKVLEDNISSIKSRSQSFDLDIQNKKDLYSKKIEELQTAIDNFKPLELTTDTQIKAIDEVLIKELKDKIEKINSENAEIFKNNEKNSKNLDLLKTKYHELDSNIAKENTNIIFNNKAIEKHKETLTLLCAECNDKFDKKYNLSILRNEIEQSTESIKKLEVEKIKYKTGIDKLQQIINTGHESWMVSQPTLKSLSCQIKDIERAQEEEIRKQKENSKKIEEYNKKVDVLKVELIQNKTKLEELSKTVNPFISSGTESSEKLCNKIKQVNDITSVINHYKYIEKILAPNCIKKIIIKDLINSLNNRIQYYMSKIGSNFTCIFDEELNYTFITASGEADYNNFSTGERMRLSIATGFAFRDFMSIRSNLTSNVLILDEFIDGGLCSGAITGLMEILKEFSIINKTNVFIISHRKEIAINNTFNNIITVQKTNGISTII